MEQNGHGGGEGGERKERTAQITQTRLVKFSREKLLRHSSVKNNNCCREMCRVNDRKYGIELMPPYFCVLNSYSKQYDDSFDLRMNCFRRPVARFSKVSVPYWAR